MIPTWDTLKKRARVLSDVRSRFAIQGYTEVQTPVLGRYGVFDPHLHSIEVSTFRGTRYLQTSPEYALKQVLGRAPERIYQIGPVFRGNDVGPRHQPEFTMLEWYAPDTALPALIEEFIDLLAGLTDAPDEWREGPAVEHYDYGELMQSLAGIDPHQTTEQALEAHLDAYGVEILHLAGPRDEQWRSDALDFIFSSQVQSRLVGLCTVSGFPGSQAALAEIDPTTGLALRTELYASGIELMNAYQELRDPVELESRWRKANEARSQRGMSQMALDAGLRDAMALMPVCAGAAVGFDRLLMCMLGLNRLDEVMILPWQDG